jgi:general secretion pathway protein F
VSAPARVADEEEPRSLSVRELATGLTILSELLDSGLPLARALDALSGLAPAGWGGYVPGLRRAVQEGGPLSDAMHAAGLPLSPVVLGLVAAGEFGGGLAPAVRRAAQQAEHEAATREALFSAITYPALVAVAGLAAMALIVGQVLPRFEVLLSDVGAELPLSTRLTLAIGGFVRQAAPWALGAVILAVGGVRRALASPESARALDRALLRLPFIGGLRHALVTSRVSNALAALLESGVPLRGGLAHAVKAAGDAEIASRLERARAAIASGSGIAKALGTLDALTPTAVRLIAAGEETGQLAPMLRHAAGLEQARAGRLIATGMRLLEPALIVLIAVAVGFVALAMLQAVYAVQPR